VVSSRPFTELANVLTVQRDSLSSDLVQFFSSQSNLGTIDSRREDSEFGHVSHLKARGTTAGRAWCGGGSAWSLRDDKGGSTSGRDAESIDGRDRKRKDNGDSLEGLHCYVTATSLLLMIVRFPEGSFLQRRQCEAFYLYHPGREKNVVACYDVFAYVTFELIEISSIIRTYRHTVLVFMYLLCTVLRIDQLHYIHAYFTLYKHTH
jgi:hypothetical protein